MSRHDDHQPDQYGQSGRVRLSSFYPTESLCVLYLQDVPAGRILGITARSDLPTAPAELAGLLADTADMLTRYPSAILVAYAADQEQGRDTIRQIALRFGPDRIITGLIAAPQGWTTVDPHHPAAIQWADPYPPGTGPAPAAVAGAGVHAMGTRDDLADSIATPDAQTAADSYPSIRHSPDRRTMCW